MQKLIMATQATTQAMEILQIDKAKVKCLITGIVLISKQEETGCAYTWRGDLFAIQDVYIINCNEDSCKKVNAVTKNLLSVNSNTITINQEQGQIFWFERKGVFIVPKTAAVLNNLAKEYIAKWK